MISKILLHIFLMLNFCVQNSCFSYIKDKAWTSTGVILMCVRQKKTIKKWSLGVSSVVSIVAFVSYC